MIQDWQRDFVNALRGAGVDEGQTILVHSSFKALEVPGTPDDVVDALLEAVGPAGTLSVPTHTWDIVNARQPVFDALLTPSHVGAITNTVRKRPDAIRSLHPTHSVAAIGARARELTEGHERHDTPCSRTSPYGRLVEWDGLIVMLGVSMLYNTTFHGVEEWAEMPWVFQPGVCEHLYTIDVPGNRIHVPSRRHAGLDRSFEATQPILERGGILTVVPWRSKPILVVRAKPMAEYIGSRLAEDSNFLLTQPYKPDVGR